MARLVPADEAQPTEAPPRPARLVPAESAQPLVNKQALIDTLLDLPNTFTRAVGGVAQGAGDLVAGAGQLVANVLPNSTPSVSSLVTGAPETLQQGMSGYVRSREQDYQRRREAFGGSPDDVDIGRFTGRTAASMALAPARAAATLPGRMLQGAEAGGAIGAVSPVDPDSQNFAQDKGVQIGLGAAVGGVAPPIVEPLIRGAAAAVNGLSRLGRGAWNSATGQTVPQRIEQTLTVELQRAGVDWRALSEDVRAGLVQETQRALRAGGTLDPQAISRLGDFQRLNMQPTQGQLTRNPLQFAREQNYSKLEPGQPLARRFTDQNTQLIEGIDRTRANLGAQSPDAYAAGQTVQRGLRDADATRRGAVDAAYTRARELAGIEADVPLQPVAQRLGNIIEDFGDDKIPGAVMKRLNEFGVNGGTQTRVFNIREAEKLKTLIGNNIDNPNTPTGVALTRLRQSVDDAVLSLAEGAPGAEAATAFQQARGAAAQRFQTLDRTPGLANAVSREPLAPEKFIDTYVVRGEVQDVANLMRQMRPEQRAEARAAVMDWIRQRAVVGVEDTAKFTQGGFNKALEALGPRKLDLIFAGDRQALEQLRALGRVGAYVQSPPVASGVNYSNTATTAADMLDRVARVPVVGPLLGRPGDIVRAQQVSTYLAPAPTQSAPPMIPRGTANYAARLAALLSGPTAANAGVADLEDNRARLAEALRRQSGQGAAGR